jgi:ribosomal protein S8
MTTAIKKKLVGIVILSTSQGIMTEKLDFKELEERFCVRGAVL